MKGGRDCKYCINCDSLRGFMCNCRYSEDKEIDGVMWHIQHGQFVHRNEANKCDHYSITDYGRDEVFVL